MALSRIISRIKQDRLTGRKSKIFHTPVAHYSPLGGPRQNIAITFGTEKLHRHHTMA